MLFYVLLKTSGSRQKNAVLQTTLIGALFSLAIEISQYVFMLGYSDIDDVIFNTLGAGAGALIANIFGERFFKVWVWLALILAVVFVVLVALGPRLGDPDKVVDLGQEQQLSHAPMRVFA